MVHELFTEVRTVAERFGGLYSSQIWEIVKFKVIKDGKPVLGCNTQETGTPDS
jgi:hypothetical protein